MNLKKGVEIDHCNQKYINKMVPLQLGTIQMLEASIRLYAYFDFCHIFTYIFLPSIFLTFLLYPAMMVANHWLPSARSPSWFLTFYCSDQSLLLLIFKIILVCMFILYSLHTVLSSEII